MIIFMHIRSIYFDHSLPYKWHAIEVVEREYEEEN